LCDQTRFHESNLLSYAIYYSLKMTRRDDGHDGRVDQSQVLSTVDEQLGIHDPSQIKRQHGASATWVELCLYVGLDELQNLLICGIRFRIELERL
jgi:hypothetical protein